LETDKAIDEQTGDESGCETCLYGDEVGIWFRAYGDDAGVDDKREDCER